jgi:hypothetical protein
MPSVDSNCDLGLKGARARSSYEASAVGLVPADDGWFILNLSEIAPSEALR